MVGPLSGQSAIPPAELSSDATVRLSDLIEPIKKTRIPDEIATRIRMLILDGTFKSGQPLPSERVLAQRFGVSRGSVRDAFRMLEMIGLLETRHGQGTFAHELSVDNLVIPLASVLTYNGKLQDELLDVRRMFEPAVARVAATRVTDEELDELKRILEAQREKVRAGQSTFEEDTAFHSALARATHNQVVVRLMETLNGLLVGSRKLTLQQKGRPLRSMQGHEAMVAALGRRDAAAAARAMTDHIDQIAELLQQTHNGHDATIERILEVLDQAGVSLSQMAQGRVSTASSDGPHTGRVDFVRDAQLRSTLERAFVESQMAFERGDFALALVSSCSVLEALVTDALARTGLASLAACGIPAGDMAGWSFRARIDVAERARVIRAGCARLPAIAREYRSLLGEHGEVLPGASVSEREAKLAGQVLNVVMRDLAPGR